MEIPKDLMNVDLSGYSIVEVYCFYKVVGMVSIATYSINPTPPEGYSGYQNPIKLLVLTNGVDSYILPKFEKIYVGQ